MAKSPAHRLGQIIGEALELAYEPILRDFADEHDLYLDRQGPRAARPGKKVSWVDINGNKHDLDFVLERGGTAQRVGVPAAFIESAWRRYTKHSRAKAQEMQGAIEPLLLAHQAAKPFAGAIVGGEWTSASLTQLRSVGFTVVHLSFSEIVAAFGTVGIDVATEEGTPLPVLQAAVDACDGMSQADKDRVGDELRACAAADFADFRARLAGAVLRKVERVTLTALHGEAFEFDSTMDAIDAIVAYSAPSSTPAWVRWEIAMRFTNGDRIEAQFGEADRATDFLKTFV